MANPFLPRSVCAYSCSTYEDTLYGDRSFAVHGPVVWNSLPADLRLLNISLQVFRKRLKMFLFVQRLTWRICCVGAKFAPYKCHFNNNNNSTGINPRPYTASQILTPSPTLFPQHLSPSIRSATLSVGLRPMMMMIDDDDDNESVWWPMWWSTIKNNKQEMTHRDEWQVVCKST